MRRTGGPRWRGLDLATLVLVVGFVLVTLGPALSGQRMMIDANTITRIQPFAAIDGPRTSNTTVCRTDTIEGFVSGFSTAKQSFAAGRFPAWSPYESGGGAFAGVPSFALFSPLTLPYYVLPVWLAAGYVKLLEVLVGMVGMFLFLRRHQVGRSASLLGGVVFTSCGFMTMWTNWPHPEVAALIPALFWGLECLVQDRRLRDVASIALVVACMLLGGFPAVTLFSLTVGGAYVLARALVVSRYSVRATMVILGGALFGVVLGGALCAIQLVPFVEDLDLFLGGRVGLGKDHNPLSSFVTTAAPEAFGVCKGGFTYGPVSPIEGVGFIGAAALILVVVALAVRPRSGAAAAHLQWFGWVALPVLVVLIWVGGPLLDGLARLPFYSSNTIVRAQSVFGFVAGTLAAIGFERLQRHRLESVDLVPEPNDQKGMTALAQTGRKRMLRVAWPVAVVGTVVGFVAVVVVDAFGDAKKYEYLPHLKANLVLPAIVVLLAAAAAAAVVAAAGRGRIGAVGRLALVALVLGQSAVFLHDALPNGDRKYLYPVTPLHAYLQAHLGGERYGSTGQEMYPATSDAYQLRTPVGHQFTLPVWRDLLLAADPQAMPAGRRTSSLFLLTAGQAGINPVLDQLAVRYWASAPGDVPGLPVPPLAAAGATRPLTLGDGDVGHCTLGAGATRGVVVTLLGTGTIAPEAKVVVHVRVHTPSGVLSGSTMLQRGPLPTGHVAVAVLGADLIGRGTYPVDVSVTGSKVPLVLAAKRGRVECGAVAPQADGLAMVTTEAGGTIWRRASALPRIRWASHSEVVTSSSAQLARLKTGLPPGTVLLDDASTPVAEGGNARVTVVRDADETIVARVDADSRGYLVVADAIVRPGWSATVDGRAAPLVHGNHAFGAIPVPAGEHEVKLHYSPPGLRAGVVVSGGAGLVLAGLVPLDLFVRRRRRSV